MTIQARFAASLVANLFRSGISFVTGLLLARWLGPSDYGRMVFLLTSFAAFKQLLDLGSSLAFFTFLSQRHRSKRFVTIFGYWVGIQFLISVSMVWFLLPDAFIKRVWLGESRLMLILALVASFMQGTVWNIASQMAEASRQTARVQGLNTLVVTIHLCVVSLMWFWGKLAIPLIFLAMAIEWFAAGWMAARMYFIGDQHEMAVSDKTDNVTSVGREFARYCFPMVPYTILSFFHDFADRWMLQNWGGASEQAYYGVAQQFAAIAMLATASILRIFWKEIAEAHYRGDIMAMETLYKKVSRMLFFVGSVIAGGLLPWAGEILDLTIGSAYAGAEITLMLMFLYPVHQSMGQIGGTMLYATGNIRLQVILGMAFMLASLIISYFMLAPASAIIPGFSLASQGLAWKMVLLQLVGVNITAWYVARLFNWSFDWIYQPFSLFSCVGFGFIAYFASSYFFANLSSRPFCMTIAGLFYCAIIGGMVYWRPGLAGVTRGEISGYIRRLF